MDPHLRGRGHIVFSRIPLATAMASALTLALASACNRFVCTLSCELLVGFLLNNWDITKNLLNFGDLDLLFKVTVVEKLKIL